MKTETIAKGNVLITRIEVANDAILTIKKRIEESAKWKEHHQKESGLLTLSVGNLNHYDLNTNFIDVNYVMEQYLKNAETELAFLKAELENLKDE